MGARLGMLDAGKPRWRFFGAGAVFQVVWLTLAITIPMLFPEHLMPKMLYSVVSLELPRTEVPVPPDPPKPKMVAKVEPKPVEEVFPDPVKPRVLAPPKTALAPKPKQLDVKAPEVKAAGFDPIKVNAPKFEPARPREEVKTGVLSANTGSAAPATVKAPINKVQTGGFGDPDGLPGNGNPNKAGNIAHKGSFDLPGGPGYGNGTGGANGIRGTVASSGFGNGIAIPPTGGGGGRQGAVRSGGFSDASAMTEAPKREASRQSTSPVTPVEILSKPDPLYTDEARRLRLEGEVLVEVMFTAGGEVRVIRVVRGLGHGLDESALRAAQQIKFKPARRDGQPVDYPATVHIVFQLAY